MFWLGFLFGDEHRQLKEIELSRKQRELEEEEKKVSFMVEDFEPFLTSMEKEGMTETSVVFSDYSRFSYNALPKALSKLGSKIAYTRLEKEEGTFTLTFYKNRPEAYSRLHRAYILRFLLWFVFALIFALLVYLVLHNSLDLLRPKLFPQGFFRILKDFVEIFIVLVSSRDFSALVFRQFNLAKDFKHTLRFDKVVADE